MPLERQEDLHATLAISPQEAERGTIRTPSLPGQRQVRITVPAQTRHGQVLRLEGLGMAAYEGGPRSALQLTIAIVEENATQRSPNIRGYASTETAREPEQIRPSQAIPPWEMPPDRPHSRGYPPPPTFYPGQANSPAIPFYGDRLPEPSSRKRNLTAWLLLILALLALSGSAELFYSNYLQRAQGPQKATSNTPSVVHAAQATTTGVALVHGTGHQTDAYDDYWQSDMVEGIHNGLADRNNLLVVNCDFDQYMWDDRAAGCLAGFGAAEFQDMFAGRLAAEIVVECEGAVHFGAG